MVRVHYSVSGLVNTTVKTQVKNVLDEIPGVSMVNVDLGRGSVEVGFGAPADEDEIRRGIEHAGCRILN